MADYKELLRRAISALPENNGAARRAVYEKARSALVGQLRAIQPPLPARDITQHRLQLEDCIRQVEQEASEAIISLGRDAGLTQRFAVKPPTSPSETLKAPLIPPVTASAEPAPQETEAVAPAELPQADAPAPEPAPAQAEKVVSIEDIIAQAAEASGTSVVAVDEPVQAPPEPIIGPKTELRGPISVVKSGPTSLIAAKPRSADAPANVPAFEPRRDLLQPAVGRNQAVARQQDVVPLILPGTQPAETALSTVREVELESPQPDPSEAESVIERAIETLDREARGETSEPTESAHEAATRMFAAPKAPIPAEPDASVVAAAPTAPRSGAGVTIFLIVFAVLLLGAGGAGFWAWREGYINLDQMFGQAEPVTETAAVSPSTTPTLDPAQPEDSVPVDGPGNTATAPEPTPASTLESLQTEERLAPTPQPAPPGAVPSVLPDISASSDPKGEERLPGGDAALVDAADPAASVDPAVLAGSQSLLLEASADGRTGAVPFSGTIEWTKGEDELGLPTIVGDASIPARNLGVQVTIRKNSDPSLPASHLMEVDFDVSDTFIGGTIANLPGVLLKDEELVPGTPLVGASARVVGNSFLFALSASPNDLATNADLLGSRKWMDLAVVYGTGRNAIITLEKDEEAQTMFDEVFTAWAQ
ncbi:hypothetical protein [Devosia submarina]|uniref:hypothetical protein n=1 Tax=Devosia submarina TaxID=1173082 RepID=UPI000D37D559|nr:hypothetical protein [Devosia submarina]